MLKLKTILFPVKTMDFVPSGIEKFKFDFQIDSPPLIEETRKALREFVIERDGNPQSNLRHLSITVRAINGIEMDFIRRDPDRF